MVMDPHPSDWLLELKKDGLRINVVTSPSGTIAAQA